MNEHNPFSGRDPIRESMNQASVVMSRLPDANYSTNYQPEYADPWELHEAIHMLHFERNRLPTTHHNVDTLQGQLTHIAEGDVATPVIIAGRCAEPVDLDSVKGLARQSIRTRAAVLGTLGAQGALYIERSRGQNTKPRSNPQETLPDGRIVPAYMGDAVNSQNPEERRPDPMRMTEAAAQACWLERELTARLGEHVPSAHEALLLPYEHSHIRITPDLYKEYLLSADMPWIGKRTNRADSDHVRLLSTVNNPVGVKIGPDSTPEHIAALAERLNPNAIPGKLTFMLRMGPGHEEELGIVANAISKYAPESLVMYDEHGVTRTNEHGEKIRCVPEIIEDVRRTSLACQAAGLMLHGLHLETTADNSRLECTDEPGQRPTHPGGVDPQLNLRQLKHVLAETKDYLLQK